MYTVCGFQVWLHFLNFIAIGLYKNLPVTIKLNLPVKQQKWSHFSKFCRSAVATICIELNEKQKLQTP